MIPDILYIPLASSPAELAQAKQNPVFMRTASQRVAILEEHIRTLTESYVGTMEKMLELKERVIEIESRLRLL